MPVGRHSRLVEKDAAEVLPVRKDLGLHRQERAARVHEVDARQAVFERDLLRAEVLLHGEWVVRATFDGRVVGDDEHLAARDAADAGDEAGARRLAVVHAPGGERRQLEERRAGVEKAVDPLPHRQLALAPVTLQVALAAALPRVPRAGSSSSATSRCIRTSVLARYAGVDSGESGRFQHVHVWSRGNRTRERWAVRSAESSGSRWIIGQSSARIAASTEMVSRNVHSVCFCTNRSRTCIDCRTD